MVKGRGSAGLAARRLREFFSSVVGPWRQQLWFGPLEVHSLCASARAPQAIGGQLSVAASGARLAAPRD